ncbi:hypothetical protein RFI_11364 [Reticulomyxa filosa]|uniref:Uncharacterized protein n=1 Tax=Reticulomyxa filosa TaxID=46433 RepID=X6NJ53_RETFI|nr:hypothetical protein RFI_11364 [Reticulomyxa filosa]|eukprot:ETO25774.1 hypothetical protein RFI_11364 [Reticulomyxa filosa]
MLLGLGKCICEIVVQNQPVITCPICRSHINKLTQIDNLLSPKIKFRYGHIRLTLFVPFQWQKMTNTKPTTEFLHLLSNLLGISSSKIKIINKAVQCENDNMIWERVSKNSEFVIIASRDKYHENDENFSAVDSHHTLRQRINIFWIQVIYTTKLFFSQVRITNGNEFMAYIFHSLLSIGCFIILLLSFCFLVYTHFSNEEKICVDLSK